MIKLERASPCSANSLLEDKKFLKNLSLYCKEHRDEPYSKDEIINIKRAFEELIPPRSIEDIVMKNFFGRRFPTWLGNATHFPSLKYLHLVDCKSCGHLPPIGHLPNLKYLKIGGASAVTKIGPEFVGYGAGNPIFAEEVVFPKLEVLIIEDMPN